MKHMKRQRAPKNWPIERKGTTFVVSGDYKGIPLLIAIRNILKLAKNKKEVKRALLKKEILISNKPAKKEKEMIKFLDTLTIVPSKKNYRLILSKSGKFDLKEIKENEKKRSQIIISEIPFQSQKTNLIEQLAKLVQDKKIQGIKDIRDESDKEGMRIAIDLQGNAYPQKILNRLYKFTDLEKTFHLNMLALVDGIQPKVLSLVDVLNYFICI